MPDADAVAAMNTDERRVSFFHQPVAARAAVVAAGPIANFLLAIAIFATIFMLYGKQETAARVDAVIPGSAAAAAGFQTGDLVLSINGKPIDTLQGHAGDRLAERRTSRSISSSSAAARK